MVLAVFCYNANAQDSSTSGLEGVNFGVKAGVNFATIAGDETDDIKLKTAFHVGLVTEIPVSDSFSVQPELLYSAQGTKGDEGDDELKMDYINIPVMAKFYVDEGFSIEAGPQVGFLVSSELEIDGQTEDIKDEMSSIDFGLNFGLGYKLETGLCFGARYNLGLSNIWDFEGSDDFKNQNSVIQISVGYFF